MSDYQAALGRDVGKVDTDSAGLARYSLRIQVPPGIRPGSEPELSLEYSQGAPNGSLGAGWALGGLSCIRRALSNLAYDGVNPPPTNYDRSQPKLTLDGAELLNIEGEYGSSNAKYMTELEQNGRVVSASGSGFVLVDSTGAHAEYGTTEDTRVLDAAGDEVREWRLSTSSDYHGNTSTYTYVRNPEGSTGNVNACYISSIRYSSNTKSGYKGGRIVKFEYSSRPDVLVQRVQGAECVWTSFLTAIRCGVIQAEVTTLGRSYELEYSQSKETGDSHLAADRGVDNLFYGTHHDLFEGAAMIFLTGAAVGLALGAATEGLGKVKFGSSGPNKLQGINKFDGSFKLRNFTGIRAILEPKPTNPWASLTKEMVKLGAKSTAGPLGKLAVWGVKGGTGKSEI